MYSVYIHKFPNGKVYVGMTSMKPETRWKKGKGYHGNQTLLNDLKKYSWNEIQHEIIFTTELKEEAELKEKETIAFYKSTDKEYGYNIQSGGKKGYTITEELKETYKQLKLGEKGYWYGKKLPKEICEKISQKKKGLRYGGALLNMRKVGQYDLNNNFIKSFNSLTEASKELNIPYQNISMCCRNVIHKTHNYIFQYIEE